MASIASLVVDIKGDASGLVKEIDKAEDKTKGFGGTMSKMGPLMATGAAAGAAAIAGIGVAALNVADDAQKATRMLQAQLGVTKDEAEALGDTAKQVFRNNFGESISEAAMAVGTIKQQLGDLGTTGLQTATENAFRLRDAFGVDVVESVDAVKTLMQQFGITSEQAFDLVTAGFQKGLNRSGDFLESITEYGTQFSSGGATAQQFFSVLESGLQGGVLGTDKAADAFKEFRVRIQDGSKATAEGLAQLGINAEEMAAKMADGTMTAADAFNLVLTKLRETGDENVRMQAGVALLGTQFEDLGQKGALGLDMMSGSFDNVTGKTKELDAQYGSLGEVVEGVKRKVIVDFLIPMGDKLLELINAVMPHLNAAFDAIGPAVDAATEQIKKLWNELGPEFLATVEVLRGHLEALVGFFREHWSQIEPIVMPVLQAIVKLVELSMTNIKEVILLAMNLIQGDWAAAWENFKTILSNTSITWKDVLQLALDAMFELIKAWPKVLLGLEAEFRGATVALGEALIDGVRQGVMNAAGRLAEAAADAVRNAIKRAKEALDIFSPSKKAAKEIGEPFVDGIIEGVKSRVPDLLAMLEDMGLAMAAAVPNPAFSDTHGTGQGFQSAAGFSGTIARVSQMETRESFGSGGWSFPVMAGGASNSTVQASPMTATGGAVMITSAPGIEAKLDQLLAALLSQRGLGLTGVL